MTPHDAMVLINFITLGLFLFAASAFWVAKRKYDKTTEDLREVQQWLENIRDTMGGWKDEF